MSTELKVTGKVSVINTLEKGVSKAGKDWQKQSFVIDTGAEYNPLICFGVFGEDKCKDLITPLTVGQEIEVSFNLSSREFKGKYYTQADCWRISAVGSTPSAQEVAEVMADEPRDDLPF